jgi:hypothetical protein
MSRWGLNLAKSIAPDVRVFGFVRHELLDGSANKASPLFQQSTGTSIGVGLLWTLARSEQRAVVR